MSKFISFICNICTMNIKENHMLRILTASSMLALAAMPAIAQQADPMATPPAAEAPAAPEAATTPAPVAPAAEPAAPATAEATQAAPTDEAAREATVAKLVETEFPSYDTDKNGDLSQAEFGTWVLALHAKAEEAGGTAKKDEAAKAKWAKDAFATADADKNKKISKAEVSKFLLG
jgi:hypothetical protein